MNDPQMEVCDAAEWETCCADVEAQIRIGDEDAVNDVVESLDLNSPLMQVLVEGIIKQDAARDTHVERALREWVDTGLVAVTNRLMPDWRDR